MTKPRCENVELKAATTVAPNSTAFAQKIVLSADFEGLESLLPVLKQL